MTNKQCRKKVKKLKRNIRQYIVDKKLEKFFEKCEEVKVVEIKELENRRYFKVHRISGASIGSIIGFAYLSNTLLEVPTYFKKILLFKLCSRLLFYKDQFL